jgi:single-stranded DNA-binding protein
MLNQVILVGTVESFDHNKIIMSVTRNYKDKETGEFLADIIKVSVTDDMSNSLLKTLKEGKTIAIKGRIEQETYDLTSRIIAEKVSYL